MLSMNWKKKKCGLSTHSVWNGVMIPLLPGQFWSIIAMEYVQVLLLVLVYTQEGSLGA